MHRTVTTMLSLALCAGATSLAAAADGDFYYDATDANQLRFDGSSEAGSLLFDSVPGRSYRVQRAGWADQTQFGFYTDADLSLSLSVNLQAYFEAGQGGPNDQALFAGVGALRGHDLIIADSQGNELTASISILELIDDTDSWIQPVLLGMALLEDIAFSSSEFEEVDVAGLGVSGFLAFTALADGNATMKQYFDDSESGSQPLLLGTLEITVGAVPAPGSLAVLALGGLGLTRRRR